MQEQIFSTELDGAITVIDQERKKKRAFKLIRSNKKLTNEEAQTFLPPGYSMASLQQLKDFKETYGPRTNDTVIALGEIGPAPFAGNPALLKDGTIVSLGIPGNLSWDEKALFLIIKDQVTIEKWDDIHEYLKTNPKDQIEADIHEKGAEKRKIIIYNGGKFIDGSFHCIFKYIDRDNVEPYEGPITTAAFEKIIIS